MTRRAAAWWREHSLARPSPSRAGVCWRESPSRDGVAPLNQPSALAITGRGSLLVVESADGRRWIVGPPARAGAGSYVIVVPQ
jgi:hypothetical protein